MRNIPRNAGPGEGELWLVDVVSQAYQDWLWLVGMLEECVAGMVSHTHIPPSLVSGCWVPDFRWWWDSPGKYLLQKYFIFNQQKIFHPQLSKNMYFILNHKKIVQPQQYKNSLTSTIQKYIKLNHLTAMAFYHCHKQSRENTFDFSQWRSHINNKCEILKIDLITELIKILFQKPI